MNLNIEISAVLRMIFWRSENEIFIRVTTALNAFLEGHSEKSEEPCKIKVVINKIWNVSIRRYNNKWLLLKSLTYLKLDLIHSPAL